MCYSAQVWSAYNRFVKEFGATIDIHAFVELYAKREDFPGQRLPKAMDAAFAALEQMRALDNGMKIAVVRVDSNPLGVDTPQDLDVARRLLKEDVN